MNMEHNLPQVPGYFSFPPYWDGILGPQPTQHGPPSSSTQAFSTSTYTGDASLLPTNMGYALSNSSQPDNNWYMDSGATSHMTHTSGNLLPLFNSSTKSNILVGNGTGIPITGYGTATIPNSPFSLPNAYLAPQIIKNLISVRKFTKDNFVSIEFDPYGFSVKDLRTGTILTRCNSSGDLYPVTSSSSPVSLAALSSSTWHNRLGHPSLSSLQSLRQNNLLEFNKEKYSNLCSSCQLGKHVKLPLMILFPLLLVLLILFMLIYGLPLFLVPLVTNIILFL